MAKFSQPKKVPQQKFFTTSCPHDEMYLRLSVLAAKNPYSKVSHGESFYSEMSYGKIYRQQKIPRQKVLIAV